MIHAPPILLLLFNIFSLVLLSSARRITFRSRHNSEPALSTQISDLILENLGSATIKAHSTEEFEIMQSNFRQRKKLENYDLWYKAVNAYTMDMFKGDYRVMLGSQFTDVGDLGNYKQCDEIENAEYNILQLNVTKLPIDIRLGLWLPAEWNWNIMKKAGEIISESLTKLVKNLAYKYNIDLLIDNDVGLQVYFFQPTARNKQASQESGTSAAAMSGFIGFLIFLAFFGSLATLKQPTKIAPPPENFKKETAQVAQQEEQDYAMRGTAAQTMRTKSSESSTPTTFHNRLAQNEVVRERDNSLFPNNRILNKLEPIQEEKAETVLRSYLKCFSVQDNLQRLVTPKRNQLDNPELDVIEAMKVITLSWAIIMYTALFALTSTCRNMPILLKFFQLYLFAIVSSGNKAGDFFFMIFTMMGFIKINQLYDARKGLGLLDYAGVILHNFLKIAPLYYLVFFAGWMMVPIISTGANWFASDRLFVSWSSDWPFVLTFLNTYFPFFTKALEGCFYWPVLIPHYIMSSFFFPIWVILYRTNKKIFLLVILLLEIAGIIIVGYICYANNLKVGILTFEDYYLYTYQFNKLHTKLFNLAIGLYAGYLYLRILKYRKASYNEKKTNFSIIHFFHNSLFANIFLYIYAIGMILFITWVPRSANENGYSWTKWQNIAYFALGTTGYLSSVLAFMFIIFFGYGNAMKAVLSSKVWVSLSKLWFGWYLIYPIVISIGFVATDGTFFASYLSLIYAFITNILISFLSSFVMHIFVQAPADGLIRVTKGIMFGDKIQTLEKLNLASNEKPSDSQKEEEERLLSAEREELGHFITNKAFKLKTKKDI